MAYSAAQDARDITIMTDKTRCPRAAFLSSLPSLKINRLNPAAAAAVRVIATVRNRRARAGFFNGRSPVRIIAEHPARSSLPSPPPGQLLFPGDRRRDLGLGGGDARPVLSVVALCKSRAGRTPARSPRFRTVATAATATATVPSRSASRFSRRSCISYDQSSSLPRPPGVTPPRRARTILLRVSFHRMLLQYRTDCIRNTAQYRVTGAFIQVHVILQRRRAECIVLAIRLELLAVMIIQCNTYTYMYIHRNAAMWDRRGRRMRF